MIAADTYSQNYAELLDATYDCVDRIVLNAYFIPGQSGGGFRHWWRQLTGSDANLDDTHLMRFAGRFSRRVHTVAEKKGIPLVHCPAGERKHDLADEYLPTDPNFQGVFCILVNRAPGAVMEVKTFKNGSIDIRRKTPYPFVNYYSFHIMDADWGHVTIRFCPHPPFSAMIMLNGHEYVTRQAQKAGLSFQKEGNCLTQVGDGDRLAQIAETMRAERSVGRLAEVCDRWLYSTCLNYALDSDAQQQSGFRYSYSVYQVEYSRNLLFSRGRDLEQVFQETIDRTRARLDVPTIRTIFGAKKRPTRKAQGHDPRFELAVEKPVYNLTVFRIHFGKITVKMYSKGERVLRAEAVIHNTKDLRCGRRLTQFPRIAETLKGIAERFLNALGHVDVAFIGPDVLEEWPKPTTVGATRIGGLDVNKQRIRAVMLALIALAPQPRGFMAADLAAQVSRAIPGYTPRQAAYDLKKFRAKELIQKIGLTRRYEFADAGLRQIAAFLTLRDKVLLPLLACAAKNKKPRQPRKDKTTCPLDLCYYRLQLEMQQVFNYLNLAA
jgi:hypothetical protein